MNKMKSKLYFFFSLIGTLLLSACGVRNHHGFVGEDARFANYTFLGEDGDGTPGLAYYADETNPNKIAVGIGSCSAQTITVSTYDGKPVTAVFPSGFQNCDTIRTITLPDTVTDFGTDAFAGSSLQSIEIPNGLEVISSGAFRNCKELVSVTFKKNNSVTTIRDYAFANDYHLSTFLFHNIDNLTAIGKEAFLYCLGLTNVIFPDSFASLESYAFQDCKNLTTIYFPASITYIGVNAFRGVGDSAKIYFAESRERTVTDCDISDPNPSNSFANDHTFSYGTYHIPAIFGVGALKIEGPFRFSAPETGKYNMNKYTRIDSSHWRDNGQLAYSDNIASDEVILMNYDDEYSEEGFDPTDIDIPSTIYGGRFKVVGIKNGVFDGNTVIKKVTFHENLRFIDAGAFANCSSLKTVNLEGAVDLQHIQYHAFANTMLHNGVRDKNHMYTIHIPSNVINIDPDAFRGCTGLFKVYFDGATDQYEDTFITDGSIKSFDLAYTPRGAVSSVRINGHKLTLGTDYSLSGNTITLTTTPSAARVVKIKYATDSTTTQKFKGYQISTNVLATEFTLSSKAVAIGSVTVTVGNTTTTYTLNNGFTTTDVENGTKTKITFSTAPAEDADIVVSYRSVSKLQKIEEYAFYGCSDDLGDATFYSKKLMEYDEPYQDIVFPASLTTIGQYAFAVAQIVGEAYFQSTTLTIGQHAFNSVESLSKIVFRSDMTRLTLNNKSFGSTLGSQAYTAGNQYKKLISVTLPKNTTVNGNEVFFGHYLLSIYCIGNVPTGSDSKTSWNKIGSAFIGGFGDFSSDAPKQELDYAPVYIVDSEDDITYLPSEDFPIFDLVKETGNEFATLANYHYYGGRIKDAVGESAITPGANLNESNTDNPSRNASYSSEYAVLMTNGHFRFEIPATVEIDGESLPVGKIGQSALGFQMNTSGLRTNNDAGSGTKTNSDSYRYWQVKENFWTMREITLPDSIKIMGDGAVIFTPVTTLKSYDGATASKPSSDGLATIWNSAKPISNNGVFPASLKSLGKLAFAFCGLTNASLPDCLEEFGGITSDSAPHNLSYCTFPFIGCFDLGDISLYHPTGGAAAAGVFSASGGAIIYESDNVMIEGAEGISSLEIPWGTLSVVAGAVRGGRKIGEVHFPYTITGISNNLLDAIGTARDSGGRSGTSDLHTVTFESGSYSGYNVAPNSVSDEDKATYNTSRCLSIGTSAFWGCGNLKNVELPVGLTTLNNKAFNTCGSLDHLTVDKGTANTSPFARVGDVDMGSHLNCTQLPSLTSIGSECFKGCKKLTQLTTYDTLNSLSASAFITCTGLNSVTLNSATKTLGDSCFNGCSNIPTITFDSSTISLGTSCFSGCTKLTTATFNSNTGTIGNSCFSGCTKLDTVTFNGSGGLTFNSSSFNGCTALKKITIPSGSTLWNTVFNGCTGLDDNAASGGGVIVEPNVTFKGQNANSAFIGCQSGARIYLEESEETYINNQTGANPRYPSGWNHYEYNGSSGSELPVYTKFDGNELGQDVPGDFPHWHYVNDVPTPW